MQTQSVRPIIKKFWNFFLQKGSFWLFLGVGCLGVFRVLHQKIPGHYRIFTGAAHALWNETSPHGTDFRTGVGYWFYSPSCGMFIFGPFSLLPEKLGLFLYTTFSWVVFVVGAVFFLGALQKMSFQKAWKSPALGLFWIAVLPQMLTALVTSKLEVMTVGLVFLSLAWLGTGQWVGWAAFILAMVLNWKLQVLPLLGLLAVFSLLQKWGTVFWSFFLLSSLFWWGVPFLFMPQDLVLSIYSDWYRTLSEFTNEAWAGFDHLYLFLHRGLGFDLLLAQYEGVSLLFGSLSAAVLWFWSGTRKSGSELVWRKGLGLVAALGMGFVVIFSPLSQNNGGILFAPVFLLGIYCWEHASIKWKNLLWGSLVGVWLIMAFGYSDVIPLSLKQELRNFGLKPVACLTLMLVLMACYLDPQSVRRKKSG